MGLHIVRNHRRVTVSVDGTAAWEGSLAEWLCASAGPGLDIAMPKPKYGRPVKVVDNEPELPFQHGPWVLPDYSRDTSGVEEIALVVAPCDAGE